ncbi:hypothetical protein FRC02_009609 [Tulasnella sp. 418]|nr:hypothetical protein FRC02_009609 [Tulasnella sp. 418]
MVEDHAESDILPSFLKQRGERLVSLRTEFGGEVMQDLSINLSEVCPNLRELVIHDLVPHPAQLRSALYLKHLEHLGWGEPYPHVINQEEAEEAIEWTMSLPSIRHVTLYLDCIEVDPEYYLVKMWRERCKNKIELTFLSKYRVMVSMTSSRVRRDSHAEAFVRMRKTT